MYQFKIQKIQTGYDLYVIYAVLEADNSEGYHFAFRWHKDKDSIEKLLEWIEVGLKELTYRINRLKDETDDKRNNEHTDGAITRD